MGVKKSKINDEVEDALNSSVLPLEIHTIREKKIQMNRVYDIDLKLREKSKDQYDLLSKMPRLVPIL